MSKSRLEWRVGLFVLIGLVLLAGLVIQFSKGGNPVAQKYTIKMRAANVGGLKKKAGVLMSGVQVGVVRDILLGPQGTNVTIFLSIYKEYGIHKDARFFIEQSGFLGDQYVAVVPGANVAEPWKPNEELSANEPFNLQDVARPGQRQRAQRTQTPSSW